MWEDSGTRFIIKIVFSVVALAVVVALARLQRGRLPSPGARRVLDATLAVLALCAVASYFEFGWLRFGRYMNPHDVYHYYIGAKYSEEHHYTNLYRCALIADSESERPVFTGKSIRNLENARMEPVATVLQKRQEWCKDGFSPERWEAFKSDVLWFRSIVPASKWAHMLTDKGYNATPVWNAVARVLANRAPTSDEHAMLALTLLDPLLLSIAFIVVFTVFGWRIGAMTLIYYGLAFWMSFVHIKGGFLRLDWVACMLMAMAALQRRRHGLAGALLAWATMARVFPVVFAAGLGAKLLVDVHDWWQARRSGNPRPFVRDRAVFFAAFAATVAVLVACSVMADGGVGLWREFAHKIGVHDNDISSTRVGFKYVWLVAARDKATVFAQTRMIYWPIVFAVVAASMSAMCRLSDVRALAFGALPFFFVVAPTFYYDVVLVVPFLGFATALAAPRMEVAAASLFVVSIVQYLVDLRADEPVVFGVASFVMLAWCGVLAWVLRAPRTVTRTVDVDDSGVAAPVVTTDLDAAPEHEQEPLPPLPPLLHPLLTARRVIALAVAVGTLAVSYEFGLRPLTSMSSLDHLEREPVQATLLPDERELVFAGDIMLARNVAATLKKNGRDFRYPFDVVRPVLQRADFAFANLESAISGRGTKVEKLHTFNAPPDAIQGVATSGLDVVSLANNHMLDFGPIALDDTERAVASTTVKGAGISNDKDPQTPVIVDARGIKIGVLAYCDPQSEYGCAKEFETFPRGPARAYDDVVARDIAMVRGDVDVLVVSIHWGKEYIHTHNARQEQLAHRLIDLGVDIVAGHHPHVQQDTETYKGKVILYSMGNFVFDQRSRADLRESRMYRVVVKKDGPVRVSYWPLQIPLDDWQTHPRDDKGFVVVHKLRG